MTLRAAELPANEDRDAAGYEIIDDDGPGVPPTCARAHLRALLHRPAEPWLRPEFRPRTCRSRARSSRRMAAGSAREPHAARTATAWKAEASAPASSCGCANRPVTAARGRRQSRGRGAGPCALTFTRLRSNRRSRRPHPRPLRVGQDRARARAYGQASRRRLFARLVGDDRVPCRRARRAAAHRRRPSGHRRPDRSRGDGILNVPSRARRRAPRGRPRRPIAAAPERLPRSRSHDDSSLCGSICRALTLDGPRAATTLGIACYAVRWGTAEPIRISEHLALANSSRCTIVAANDEPAAGEPIRHDCRGAAGVALEGSASSAGRGGIGLAMEWPPPMIGMVLVTHGHWPTEFRAALEHVVGPQQQSQASRSAPTTTWSSGAKRSSMR